MTDSYSVGKLLTLLTEACEYTEHPVCSPAPEWAGKLTKSYKQIPYLMRTDSAPMLLEARGGSKTYSYIFHVSLSDTIRLLLSPCHQDSFWKPY
ncbi:hypothetical protein STEG23_008819 [Scotinomys teguina]